MYVTHSYQQIPEWNFNHFKEYAITSWLRSFFAFETDHTTETAFSDKVKSKLLKFKQEHNWHVLWRQQSFKAFQIWKLKAFTSYDKFEKEKLSYLLVYMVSKVSTELFKSTEYYSKHVFYN